MTLDALDFSEAIRNSHCTFLFLCRLVLLFEVTNKRASYGLLNGSLIVPIRLPFSSLIFKKKPGESLRFVHLKKDNDVYRMKFVVFGIRMREIGCHQTESKAG